MLKMTANHKESNLVDGLYYEVSGTGEPIIFLHGIGGTHEMFAPQVEELTKEGFKCITVDLKGNGQSESVSTFKYLQVHHESLIALMDKLQLENAIFVGLSYGGIVTQTFAIKYPERVKKMVLIDTYAHIVPRDAQEFKLMLFGALIAVASWMPKSWAKRVFAPYRRWDLAHKEFMKITDNWRAKDVTLQLMEVLGMNLLEELGKLDIPVLVIVGDVMPKIVAKSEEIAKACRYGRFEPIADSLDPTNLCQPEKVNAFLKEFAREKEKALV